MEKRPVEDSDDVQQVKNAIDLSPLIHVANYVGDVLYVTCNNGYYT